MGIGVIVDINLRPGGAALWTATSEERFPTARSWKGCEHIYLGVDQNDPNHLIMVQKWTSKEDHANYRDWADAQPRSEEMLAFLVDITETTYLDHTKV